VGPPTETPKTFKIKELGVFSFSKQGVEFQDEFQIKVKRVLNHKNEKYIYL